MSSERPGRVALQPMGHIPALDGLRAFAIGFVFLLHLYATIFSGGNSGVDLFFVLSGFLITKLALEERQKRGSVSLSDFYLRRVFRILPALAVLLVFLLVLSFGTLSDVGHTLRLEILLSAASMGNLWALFYGFDVRTALAHTWSLGLEEQFYVVWPMILALVPLVRRSPIKFARVVVIATVASVLIGRVVVAGFLDYPHWESIPFFNFDGLAIGCLIAIWVHHDSAGQSWKLPQWPAALAAAFVIFDLVAARVYFDHDPYHVRTLLLRVAFGYLVLVTVSNLDPRAAKALSVAPLTLLGRLSYSLYLWHVPVFFILSKERHPDISRPVLVVVRAVAALGAAALSYYFIERPALAFGRRVRAARTARAGALAGMAVEGDVPANS
jgi:peptidoglycan/LPS O-acetylase OafA/YrhL